MSLQTYPQCPSPSSFQRGHAIAPVLFQVYADFVIGIPSCRIHVYCLLWKRKGPPVGCILEQGLGSRDPIRGYTCRGTPVRAWGRMPCVTW